MVGADVAKGYATPLIAIFLAVVGSRLWLIQNYGSDIPFWDQWGAEALMLYKPMVEGGYGAVDWFGAHNEHRIVLTRLTAAVMFVFNGQWDPLLQMCWGAICAGAIATLLCISAVRLMPGDRTIGLVFGIALAGFTMPFAWENTLAGFQSQFYYLILLAVAMFHLCAYRGLLTWKRFVLIGVVGALSLVTMALGALACLAAACQLVIRLTFVRQADARRVVALCAALTALTVLGLATTPTVAGLEFSHVQKVSQSLKEFDLVLGWPTKLGWLIWLPFAAWCLQTILRRTIGAPGIFLVGLAAFVLLNAAAVAVVRGGSIRELVDIASRYTDIAWFGLFVNCMATTLLFKFRNDERSTVVARLFAMSVFIGAMVTLGQAGLSGLTFASQRGAVYAVETANTRDYVANGDPGALRGKTDLQIPFPDAGYLIDRLDDPTIRALLPPGIRQGILARSGAPLEILKTHGFVLTGAPPGEGTEAPSPYRGWFYGTWGETGNEHTARFVSGPIESQGPTVRTWVSGFLGRPGLSLFLEDVATGKRVDLRPDRVGADKWTSIRATPPGQTYRLVAEDSATGADGWFAFTDPVEVGRIRGLAEYLIRIGKGMTFFGLALFLASVRFGRSVIRPRGEAIADA